ncbi:MAG TPA: DUF1573 domain-containing protein [Isosphaeraceae bacterium]|jgi:hypothetical protein|nr:DUF1573 domain-containing protein [Isosphaeraceae bacterium]
MVRSRRLLSAAFLLTTVLSVAAWTTLARGRSAMVPESDSHDFGEVLPGQLLSHRFTLKVGGLWPVRITRVITSCGCLDVRAREIAGGYEVEMIMEAAKRPGHREAFAEVETDEARGNVHTLRLAAEVVSPVDLDPPIPNLGSIARGATRAARAEVHVHEAPNARGKLEAAIVDRADPPTVRILERRPDGALVLGVADDAPIGPLTASLRFRFRFRDGKTPPLDIPIRGRVSGDLRASPPEVLLDWDRTGRPPSAHVEIVAPASQDARCVALGARSGALREGDGVRLSIRQADGRTFLDLTLDPTRLPRRPTSLQGIAGVVAPDGSRLNILIFINLQ